MPTQLRPQALIYIADAQLLGVKPRREWEISPPQSKTWLVPDAYYRHHKGMLKRTSGRASFVFFLSLLGLSAAHAKVISDQKARPGDVATDYALADNGNLYRTVKGARCLIADRVEEFKIPQHPRDTVAAYIVRRGDLFILENTANRGGQCPGVNRKLIMSYVRHEGNHYLFEMQKSPSSPIVNVALDKFSTFVAWNHSRVIFEIANTKTFELNSCYGRLGAALSPYVVFAYANNATVVKVRGHNPEASKIESGTFKSIAEYRQHTHACTALRNSAFNESGADYATTVAAADTKVESKLFEKSGAPYEPGAWRAIASSPGETESVPTAPATPKN